MKIYNEKNVLDASKDRMDYVFSEFDKIIVSFSGGKDSSVMVHLAAESAKKHSKKFALMIIDLEAQYRQTIEHIQEIISEYSDIIDPYWICLPMSLRNASSNFEPKWCCWDEKEKEIWVREMPKECISELSFFPFFQHGMEFEEFIILFAEWYSGGENTATLVGIRADESLNRYRTIASRKKEKYKDKQWSTKILDGVYNFYPIYDWKTSDIWVYKNTFKNLAHNKIYDLMHQAGVKPSQQRLCQPYGDDQRRGLWLYHLLEPQTWSKVVTRVSGANSMSLYVEENGNITGYNKIYKPDGHTYKSFCNLLLTTMPEKLRAHYLKRFKSFIKGWRGRGYDKDIPDEAPLILENKHWAPSYRRLCKVLLRNDYWCKGLGLTQPKSEAYGKYLKIRDKRKALSS
jgi:predicted phosphoadenosine phosphosulfate sulfurtransferase